MSEKTDKIKADIAALNVAEQSEAAARQQLNEDVLDELSSLDTTTAPPPVDTTPPPPVDTTPPPPVDTTPPPAPALTLVTLISTSFTQKVAAHPGAGGNGNVVALVKMGSSLPPYWKPDPANTADAPPKFNDGHNGYSLILDGCVALFCWAGLASPPVQLWPADAVTLPDGFLGWSSKPTPPPSGGGSTPPTGGTTTTPPATVPTSQVIPVISMPADGVSIDPSNLTVIITPADKTKEPVVVHGSDAQPDQIFRNIKVAFAGIEQRHARVVSADGLWAIRFMPDANGKRIEISWQYGNSDIATPNDFGPYTIEFFAGEGSLGSYTLTPGELWDAEPRVATSDRADAMTRQQIFAKKWLPIYGVTPVSKKTGPGASKSYLLGGISNVTAYMGQTGGRPDIGYDHEYASHFFATGDALSRRATRDWAEASCTGPWHLYDNKGRMFDFQKNPTASTYNGAANKPPIYQGPKDPLFAATQFLPDDPHMPDLSFPEFIITGDPKHARELMNQANYYLGGEHGDGSDVHAALMKIYGPKTFEVESSQERGAAWMLRLFLQCYMVSLLIDDETLLQTPFWKMVMDRNRDIFISLFVNNTTEARCSIFRAFPNASIFSSWQQDFMYGVLGAMQQSGLFPDWQPIYDWVAPALLARRDPASGDKRCPAWYYAYGALPTFTADAANTGTFSLDALKFNGWATHAKASYLQFGDWNFLMVDDTNFTLTHASGDRVLKGAVGTMFGGTDIGKNPGMNFTISGAPKAGDKGVLNIRDFTSWKEFFDTNNFDPHWTTWTDYIGDYRWALTNFAGQYPAIAAILPGLETEMQDNKLQIDWKYATLPMAA